MSSRITYIDTAKAFFIFFIVLCYALSDGEIYHYLISFAVPAFFFLLGMVFHISDNSRFSQYTFNKAKRILIPYFLFGLLMVIIFFIIGLFIDIGFDTSLGKNILQLLNGCGLNGRMSFNPSLWILPCLFVVYLAAYGIETAMRKIYGDKKIIGYALMTVIFSAFGYLGSSAKIFTDSLGLKTSFFGLVPLTFGLGTATNMMPFFLIGMLLSELKITTRKYTKTQIIFAAVAGIVCGGVLTFFNDAIKYTENDYGNYIIFFFSALFSAAGWTAVAIICERATQIVYIGKRAIIIFCLHMPLIYAFKKVVPFFSGWLSAPSSFLGIVSALFVSALSIFISLVAEYFIVRYIPFILGKFKISFKKIDIKKYLKLKNKY